MDVWLLIVTIIVSAALFVFIIFCLALIIYMWGPGGDADYKEAKVGSFKWAFDMASLVAMSFIITLVAISVTFISGSTVWRAVFDEVVKG